MDDLQGFIEALKDRLPIETVVGQRVQLQRRGNRYWGLCPFHAEKSPSFTLLPNGGYYKCFGCGKAGDILTFVRETEGLDFMDALRVLADQAGLPLPDKMSDGRSPERADQRQAAREALQLARRFFQERLKAPEAEAARQYLQGRGISGESAQRFGLGWAPRDRSALIGHLRSKKIPEEAMESAGLILRDEEGRGAAKDRFWERLMFPVNDAGGRTVGFGGRYLPGSFAEEKSLGKYVNSPEGPLFPKRRLLYGMEFMAAALRDQPQDPVLVVEGYLDVVLLHQAGFRTAVAALGTALTEDHARRLLRCERPVIILLDADEAGRRAAAKAARHLIAEGADARVAELPDGCDPADVVSSGRLAELRQCLANSRDILRWRLETWKLKTDLSVPAVVHQAAQEMAGWISSTLSPVVAEAWTRSAAGALGISERALRDLVQPSGVQAAPGPAGGATPRPTQRSAQEVLTANEREIVLAVLKDPSVYALFRAELDVLELQDSTARKLLSWCRSQRALGEDFGLENALPAFAADDPSAWLDGLRHARLPASPADLLQHALDALPGNRERAHGEAVAGRPLRPEDLSRFRRPVAISLSREHPTASPAAAAAADSADFESDNAPPASTPHSS